MRMRGVFGIAVLLGACSSSPSGSSTDDGTGTDTGSGTQAPSTMTAAMTTAGPSTGAEGTGDTGSDDTSSSSADTSTGTPDPSTGGTETGSTDSGGTDTGSTDSGSTDTGGMPSGPAVHVAGGTRHTCAVLEGGGVKCWGSGFGGALGYGNESNIGGADTPADHGLVDIGGTAVQVAAGFTFSCALLDDGSVTCWGATQALGYGNSDFVGDDEVPADVGTIDVGGTVTSISAGAFHVCALLDTDEVKCWGSNGRGQLGQGDTEHIGDDELPSAIGPVDLGGPVQKVLAGFDCSCALLQSGEVRCWGFGENGRLGLGGVENIGDDELPLDVPPISLGGGTVVDLTLGTGHACALFDDGSITCWGIGVWGALGYASTENVGDDELPSEVGLVDLGAAATGVWAGSHNTCAKLQDDTIRCWGLGDLGANGYGSTETLGDDEVPATLPAVDFGTELFGLTEGQGEHFCGLADEGLMCWGDNGWSQLGLGMPGSVGNDETPASVGFVPL